MNIALRQVLVLYSLFASWFIDTLLELRVGKIVRALYHSIVLCGRYCCNLLKVFAKCSSYIQFHSLFFHLFLFFKQLLGKQLSPFNILLVVLNSFTQVLLVRRVIHIFQVHLDLDLYVHFTTVIILLKFLSILQCVLLSLKLADKLETAFHQIFTWCPRGGRLGWRRRLITESWMHKVVIFFRKLLGRCEVLFANVSSVLTIEVVTRLTQSWVHSRAKLVVQVLLCGIQRGRPHWTWLVRRGGTFKWVNRIRERSLAYAWIKVCQAGSYWPLIAYLLFLMISHGGP